MENLRTAIAQMIAQTHYAEAECEERMRSKLLKIRRLGQAALDLREGNVPMADEDVWGAEESTEGGRR